MVTYRDEGDTINIMLPHEAQEILDAIAIIKSKLTQFRTAPESMDLEALNADKEFQEAVEIANQDDDISLSSHLEEISANPSRTNEILDDIFLELEGAEDHLNSIIDDEPDISIPGSDPTDLENDPRLKDF